MPSLGALASGTTEIEGLLEGDDVLLRNVLIEIADDGRGIDAERVAARARERGLISGDARLDEAQLLELICAPGFSTRDEADRASGRGVGMDVVANTIEELGGSITVTSEPGKGSSFTIQIRANPH